MSTTKKHIVDSIRNQASKFKVSDELRLDPDWLGDKVDQIASQLKIAQYLQTGILDQTWLTDLGLVDTYKVNMADDINVTFCNCTISKFTIPQTISFISKDGNLDLGVYQLISACGKYQFFPRRMSMWSYTPEDSPMSKFKYYSRINTACYLNDGNLRKIRPILCLLHPEDGKLINSANIVSGDLVSGTSYTVKFGGVVYLSIPYSDGDTFTANATATFTGTGKVYLTSQARAYAETDPYPASGEMIRMIELEILTKELGIEKQQIADQRNDSIDDSQKTQ